jgi:uncharacterized protein DUF4365
LVHDAPVHPSAQKEAFSRAYFHAVVAAAGFGHQPGTMPDDDSVDVTIVASRSVGGGRIDVQLKSTADERGDGDLKFELERKNYRDLQGTENLGSPRILVVVYVPVRPDLWAVHSDDLLELRHCAYWVSLRDVPKLPDSQASKTITIPRRQHFCAEQLTGMMTRVCTGGVP